MAITEYSSKCVHIDDFQYLKLSQKSQNAAAASALILSALEKISELHHPFDVLHQLSLELPHCYHLEPKYSVLEDLMQKFTGFHRPRS